MVSAGSFRADLLARLAGFTLALPPLRERREDLGLLISALLRRHAPSPERATLSPEAARHLAAYSWPLNVRELERALAAGALLAQDGPILPEHLPAPLRAGPGAPDAAARGSPPPELPPADLERRARIVALLEQHGGNLTAVARELGKARTQVQRWIKRYRIDAAALRK
jgi:transcriptional regulator with GAF, ATPase, and Fis domain